MDILEQTFTVKTYDCQPDGSIKLSSLMNYLQEAAVPLRSETHAGHDVVIYAAGPRAQLFHGVREQSYVYYVARAALGWDRPEGLLGWLFQR